MKLLLRKRLSTGSVCIAACLMHCATAFAGQAPDQSFYLGQPVTHPEELSGIWEAPDGHGGILGLQLTLFTTVPAAAKTLSGTPQSWFALQLALYRSPGTALDYKDGGGGSDSERGDGLRYQAGRLTLHNPPVDLDLFHNARDQWTGHLRRPGFNGRVTLRRPGAERKQGWPDGTWSSGESPLQYCLHIAEDKPGHHVAWVDTLQLFGLVRFAPNVPRPPSTTERYGDLVDVKDAGPTQASITLGAYNGLCCSHTFLATVAADGASMRADWPPGPNQEPHTTTWVHMDGNSCVGSPAAGR